MVDFVYVNLNSSVRMYTYGQVRTGNDVYAYWVNDKFGTNAYRCTLSFYARSMPFFGSS